MAAGGGTFINDMMKHAGFMNVFQSTPRYPEISLDNLLNSEAEYVLLSSEPYPFRQEHINELSEKLPGKKIVLVDGEMFSWYGSRLTSSAGYFKQLHQLIGSHVF
jgi:ABC-type Fe3+-hydroxamate transport system substrate-binding protein